MYLNTVDTNSLILITKETNRSNRVRIQRFAEAVFLNWRQHNQKEYDDTSVMWLEQKKPQGQTSDVDPRNY